MSKKITLTSKKTGKKIILTPRKNSRKGKGNKYA